MDVLKDKQKKEYNYISRYASFPIYYNTVDKKYVYGTTSYLRDSISYIEHGVKQGDTFESLSEYYYGRPDYYWVIADFNRIQDSFTELFRKYKTIKIPSISSIVFKK